MWRRKINRYIEQNCAPSWIYLQDYSGMHRQENIKFTVVTSFGLFRLLLEKAPFRIKEKLYSHFNVKMGRDLVS